MEKLLLSPAEAAAQLSIGRSKVTSSCGWGNCDR
jgi:hypothetical protein